MMKPPAMQKFTRGSDMDTDTVVLINKSSSERERRFAERKMTHVFPQQKFSLFEMSKLKHQQHMSQKSSTGSSLNGGSSTVNYWKRSKWSWFGLAVVILGLIWLYSYYSETQRKLRFESYLERAEELDAMIKQMEVHISSAQSKLQEMEATVQFTVIMDKMLKLIKDKQQAMQLCKMSNEQTGKITL